MPHSGEYKSKEGITYTRGDNMSHIVYRKEDDELMRVINKLRIHQNELYEDEERNDDLSFDIIRETLEVYRSKRRALDDIYYSKENERMYDEDE